jgi:hypothetical protein
MRKWAVVVVIAVVCLGIAAFILLRGEEPRPEFQAADTSPKPSTSAAVSPSRSPERKAGCASAPSACGYPDASNTGVPPGTSLTVQSGDLTVRASGAVIEGKDIRGCVNVEAANVTIRKSKVSCKDFYVILNRAGGLLVEDVEISCGRSNGTGIGDHDFTARRVHITGCENGFDIDADATVEESYIHDLYEGTTGHADGIQLAGGAHITIRHNTIFNPGGTSAIISHPNRNEDVLVSDNFLAGGAYTLYCPRETSKAFRVIGNRFGKAAYGPWDSCKNVAELRGNYWDANLKPLA